MIESYIALGMQSATAELTQLAVMTAMTASIDNKTNTATIKNEKIENQNNSGKMVCYTDKSLSFCKQKKEEKLVCLPLNGKIEALLLDSYEGGCKIILHSDDESIFIEIPNNNHKKRHKVYEYNHVDIRKFAKLKSRDFRNYIKNFICSDSRVLDLDLFVNAVHTDMATYYKEALIEADQKQKHAESVIEELYGWLGRENAEITLTTTPDCIYVDWNFKHFLKYPQESLGARYLDRDEAVKAFPQYEEFAYSEDELLKYKGYTLVTWTPFHREGDQDG